MTPKEDKGPTSCFECKCKCDGVAKIGILANCGHRLCMNCFTGLKSTCSSCREKSQQREIMEEFFFLDKSGDEGQQVADGEKQLQVKKEVEAQTVQNVVTAPAAVQAQKSTSIFYSYPNKIDEEIYKLSNFCEEMWTAMENIKNCLIQRIAPDFWSARSTVENVIFQIATVKKEMLHLAVEPFLKASAKLEILEPKVRELDCYLANQLYFEPIPLRPQTVLDLQVKEKNMKIMKNREKPEVFKKISNIGGIKRETVLKCFHGTEIPSDTPLRADGVSVFCSCDGYRLCVVGESRAGLRWVFKDCHCGNETYFQQIPTGADANSSIRCRVCSQFGLTGDVPSDFIATRILVDVVPPPPPPPPHQLVRRVAVAPTKPLPVHHQKVQKRIQKPLKLRVNQNSAPIVRTSGDVAGCSKWSTGMSPALKVKQGSGNGTVSGPEAEWARVIASGNFKMREDIAPKTNVKRKKETSNSEASARKWKC